MLRRATLAAVILSVAFAASVPAGASTYPSEITAAAANAYGGSFAEAVRWCEVYVGNRDLEGLVEVKLKNGRRDVAAFQFINTAGWFNYWRLERVAPGVGTMRPYVPGKLRALRSACGTNWSR